MSVVLLSRDLMTASRVEGAAMRQQVAVKTVGSAEQAAAVCAELRATLVIVDLTAASLDIAALVSEIKKLADAPAIVAFGPHVHEAALNAAQEAGCDAVLTRGQFFADMDSVVARAAGPR